MRRGLVVGKFLPVHSGHEHLIATALHHCDALDVWVFAAPADPIAGELRAAWLRELFPRASVRLFDDIHDTDDSAIWAERTVRWLGRVPDVVFTSEAYGEVWAAHMGCPHVLVDRERVHHPVSGTLVRSDPLSNWAFLSPPVRAYFALRVVVVGSESSGTTTLASALVDHYQTSWVAEYGREYCEALPVFPHNWTDREFDIIATEQQRRENAAARTCNRILVCDTDALATAIWQQRYMGAVTSELDAFAGAVPRPRMYLVTDPTIPFVQDGIRDGEHLRAWMHERFITELGARGHQFSVVTGTHEERMTMATDAITTAMSAIVTPPMAVVQ